MSFDSVNQIIVLPVKVVLRKVMIRKSPNIRAVFAAYLPQPFSTAVVASVFATAVNYTLSES